MKKYLFLLTLFGCFALASCTKDNVSSEASVKGRVLELDSDIGIPNVGVRLVESNYDEDFWNPKRTVIQRTQSDASGNYRFNYTSIVGRSYDVEAYNNFPAAYYSDVVSKLIDKTTTVDLQVTAFARLKIHVKNVNPVGEEDVINFNYGVFSGRSVDTTILVKKAGSNKIADPIGIKIKKNGVETSKIIEVRTPPRDTTKLDIFY